MEPARLRVLTSLLVASVSSLALGQSVPCEKYELENGMTVILHEDPKIPFAAVNTWFRVGSKDEPPGRTGFAHLFEHLMFMGTDRVPGNQFDLIMEGGGGSNNASTSEDRTNYFSQGPAALLPTLLWLDADRLEAVGRTMDQTKLDRQRDIVRNEIRQQVENRPYGRVEERIFALLFPEGHPYHHAVYGTHADLEAATVNDVRDFFANFYVPNNASLVVAGDFDSATIKPLIQSLFGTLPRGAEPLRPAPSPVTIDRVARTTLLDRVQQPLVQMAWIGPVDFAPGTAELDLLAEMLAAGKDSRLYQRLVVQEQLAVEVEAYLYGLALGSTFVIGVYADPAADLDRVEAIIDEELERVRTEGVTAAEVEQRKTDFELGQLQALQDVTRVADMLNAYEFAWGEPDSFARDLERYRAVDAAGVRDWARQVLDPGRRVIVRVLPQEAETLASARDTRPADLAAQPFDLDAPAEFRLESGVRVLHWQRSDLPLVAVNMLFAPGTPLVKPAQAGLTGLVARMLSEGAGDLDSTAFASALQALGARLRTRVDHEAGAASLLVLRRNLRPAVDLLADAVRRPRMQAADFERVKRLALESLRADAEDPRAVADRVAMRLFFGEGDPYGWPAAGTTETIEELALEEVRAEHARLFGPDDATILIAGDLTAEEARDVLEPAFGAGWSAGDGAVDAAAPTPEIAHPAGLRVAIVDRPEAVQTMVRLMAPAPRYTDASRMARQMLGTLLGGSFSSRLNLNLRETHGYTYGARSAFAAGPWRGWFSVSTSVQTGVTGPALQELFGELERLRSPAGGDVTPAEAEKARATIRANLLEAFASLDGLLSVESELVQNGLAYDQTARDLDVLDGLTADDLNAVCRTFLDLDHGLLVLVGDRAQIRAQIADLDLPDPIDCDDQGRPLEN